MCFSEFTKENSATAAALMRGLCFIVATKINVRSVVLNGPRSFSARELSRVHV